MKDRTPDLSIDEIISDFELLDDWEDRYRYVIELGKRLPALPESEHTDANRVQGCASQVWLATDIERQSDGIRLYFNGDSDALIVRGLVAIVVSLFSGKTTAEIGETDAGAVFDRLDLKSHLTAQRSNGLKALVDRIKTEATAAGTVAA